MEQKARKRSELLHEENQTPPITPSKTNKKIKKNSLATKSNQNIIKNALMHVCLAGTLNRAVKEEVLQVRGKLTRT